MIADPMEEHRWSITSMQSVSAFYHQQKTDHIIKFDSARQLANIEN